MLTFKHDPIWDAPEFERPYPERPATLRQLVNWAYHIHRSDPGIYTALLKLHTPKLAAKALWRAYQNARPVEEQKVLAQEFNESMIALKKLMDTPKSSKPTVGKPQDRFGERKRREEAKLAERQARRTLKDSPAPAAPAGSLFEGLL